MAKEISEMTLDELLDYNLSKELKDFDGKNKEQTQAVEMFLKQSTDRDRLEFEITKHEDDLSERKAQRKFESKENELQREHEKYLAKQDQKKEGIKTAGVVLGGLISAGAAIGLANSVMKFEEDGGCITTKSWGFLNRLK